MHCAVGTSLAGFIKALLVLSAVHHVHCTENAKSSKLQPPNIILIVADDLGWDDVSFHGSEQISTPNIDALAHSGTILNNYYVQPICTPTRAALMTGRHPIHLGLQHGVLGAARPDALGVNETLLPQHLKKLGYRNHMVGKWHLGFYAKEFTPTYRGFESHFGYWQGAEDYFDHTSWQGRGYWGLDFHQNMESVNDQFGQYSTEIFTHEAEKIINKHNQSEPLFLYLAHQAVHVGNSNNVPLQAPQKYINRFPNIKNKKRRAFAGMVAALDDSVGNIMKALHERGLLSNSIIVFTTDNGGPANGLGGNCACNWPLRGAKHTLWEGGVRGDGFIWSPLIQGTKFELWEGGVRGNSFMYGGALKGGKVSNHMMHVCDWLPTLVRAAGGDASVLKNLDGFDMWDTLTKEKPSPRTEILHNIDPTNKRMNEAAIRVGDYKLIMGESFPYGHDYNGWYPPTETCGKGEEGNINRMDQEVDLENIFTHKGNDHDETLKYLQQEQAHYPGAAVNIRDILNIPKDVNIPKPIVVTCGKRPANASTNCNPGIAPCLYHIPTDPCEFNNLAEEKPAIVLSMMSRLHAWNITSVPVKHSRNDPRGSPDNFNGVWTPWLNLTSEELLGH